MARKLLIALWRYAEDGVVPAGVDIRATGLPLTIYSGRLRYGECDRLLLWQFIAAAFQVGRVSPGLRLVQEAFWCAPLLWPDRM